MRNIFLWNKVFKRKIFASKKGLWGFISMPQRKKEKRVLKFIFVEVLFSLNLREKFEHE